MSRRGLLAIADLIVERRQDLDKLKEEIAKLEAEGPEKAKALAGKRKKLAEWGAYTAPPPWLKAPELPDNIREVLIGEREELGFYSTSHPLDHTHLPKSDSTTDVRESGSGRWLSVSGVVSDSEVKMSRRGTAWARFRLEDLQGACPAIAFGDSAEGIVDGAVLTVRGVVESRDGGPVLKVTNLKTLERW